VFLAYDKGDARLQEQVDVAAKYVTRATLSFLFLAMCASPSSPQTANEIYLTEVATVVTGRKAKITYLALRSKVPSPEPRVAILLFAGGDGALHIARDGSINSLAMNYLIRSRELFLTAGVDFVAAVDAPSDHGDGMDAAFRLSKAHADDIGDVIQNVRARSGLPVWLIGTSAGTLSAASVTARLSGTPASPQGLVLTSTIAQRHGRSHCARTVLDAALAAIQVPVLIVAHGNDTCICTPAAGADLILRRLPSSIRKEKRIFTGGLTPVSDPCEARSQHGYYGIEQGVASFITKWIKATP
jgi:hypothetical protein